MMKPEALAALKLLSEAAPFAGLPQAEREALAVRVPLLHFAPKQVIFSEDEAAAAAWMVHAGKVRIQVYYAGSRPMQMELLGRGDIFGLFCRLSGGRGAYPCTAIAEGRVSALRIPDELFQGLYRRHLSVARESCELCSLRLNAVQKMVSFGREDAEQRVAEVLLRLYRTSGTLIPATRSDLAVQAGTALETVFRILASFRKQGWIKTLPGAVKLLQPEALRSHTRRQRG